MRTASILIRAKNEARSIGATLDGVFAQTVCPHEVIIIDSGSRDATVEIASRYSVRILHMSPKNWSYSRALNLGAREATGEILVCLSAHCPPVHNEWLANLVRHFDDQSVAAAWGPSHRPDRPLPRPGPPLRQQPGSYTFETRTFGLENSNSALRRDLWLQFPFDERLPATEDKAWGRNAMALGYTVVYDEAAAVWHERHPIRNSFRRNKAVLAGFRMLFPEMQTSSPTIARRAGARMARKLVQRARERNFRRLWIEAKAAPSTLAGILGKLITWR